MASDPEEACMPELDSGMDRETKAQESDTSPDRVQEVDVSEPKLEIDAEVKIQDADMPEGENQEKGSEEEDKPKSEKLEAESPQNKEEGDVRDANMDAKETDAKEEAEASQPQSEADASKEVRVPEQLDASNCEAKADSPEKKDVDMPELPDTSAGEAKADSPEKQDDNEAEPLESHGVGEPSAPLVEEADAPRSDANTAVASSETKATLSMDQDVVITVVIDGDDASAREMKLRVGEVVNIGRFVHNQIVLEHRGISNKHCAMKLAADGSLTIKDMSSNGTGLRPPGANGAALLTKGHETPVPDGSLVLLPMSLKTKKGDDPAWNQRRSFTVRFGELTPDQIRKRSEKEAKARQPVEAEERAENVPEKQAKARQELESNSQLPTVSSLLDTKIGSAEKDAPALKPKLNLPSGSQLRPKALPRRPEVASAKADARMVAAGVVEASQKAASPQKSRSRDRSCSGSGGRSKSRSRGRGRGRKKGRSSSHSRSPSRKRKRKRRRSKARRRKRRRSKSRKSESSDSKSSGGDDQPAAQSGTIGQTGNAMAGMPPSWGMAWGAQASPWGWNPHMQGAAPQMNADLMKQQIYFMYQRFKPEKLPEFETIMKKYQGSEYELLQAMCKKYLGGGASAGGQ